MLIQRAPDVYDKIRILGGMAGDDVLAPSQTGSGSQGKWAGKGVAGPYSAPDKRPLAGVYRAAMPSGNFINLMRVMFTDFCMMDCAYCPNSICVPRKRYAFKVDELADAFMELHRCHTVAGLFLSSGIAGSGSKTTERMVKVVEVLRRKHNFRGYVHLKVMPGAEYQYVEAAHRLGTRLSVNIETPTAEAMKRISPHKDFENGILAPMSWINGLTRSTTGGAVGQATQFVVGAADESDADIFRRVDQLYGDWNLKRVYYAAFRPASDTPLEEKPPVPPLREHRLYQMDWLKRIYQYSNDELDLSFDGGGFLPLDQDPKTAIALENLDTFPVDLNTASRELLLRVPGLGPTSAQRILDNRRHHSIDNWSDLTAMGVVRKRAWPFVVFPGQRPPSGKQLRLDLFPEGARETVPSGPAPAAAGAAAPCGLATSCNGCSLRGTPGHPA
ncbi:MAG: helix-hairpin-helix domain-containing protein [Chloroflexota bacterium]|nr:helix-hairpin-helix domain-containing protein [Chloroflexota bacterium]